MDGKRRLFGIAVILSLVFSITALVLSVISFAGGRKNIEDTSAASRQDGGIYPQQDTDNGKSDAKKTDTIKTDTIKTDMEEGGETDIGVLAASVVKLEVYDRNGGRTGTGSGFAVLTENETVLVTARHVVVNMDYMTATRDDGTSFRIEKINYEDEETDIAVCALPAEAGLTPLILSEALPERGSEVTVIGSQFGILNLVTKGTACGIWEVGDTSWVLFTAPVSGGSSGGPVIVSDGTVAGVVTGTYEKAQTLNLAAPAEAIRELLGK